MAKQRRGRQPFASGSVSGRPARQRQLRVGEELRHALSEILREGECRDPMLDNASITVTEVRISPDLRNATAFVMPLAGANAGEILTALNRCAPFLKGLLARRASLRYTPDLTLALDGSFDAAERIAAVLARPEVARDLQPQAARSEEPNRGD